MIYKNRNYFNNTFRYKKVDENTNDYHPPFVYSQSDNLISSDITFRISCPTISQSDFKAL